MARTILLLPGDGIGPEVISEAEKILAVFNQDFDLDVQVESADIGGAAYEKDGNPLPEEVLAAAKESSAILLGAVGGPQWETLERHLRPEAALLKLRAELDLFSNLRPAILFSQLADSSSLKPELVRDLDIMIVRELTGGIYFGQPRGVETRGGERVGFNTLVYSESEISRIAHSAFKIAQARKKRLCSVDKANVLEVSGLWRDVVESVATAYPDIELSHMYVDNAAMQLIRAPKQFDVIVTGNMFGDILSDCAAMLTGSIGMLPSASLNESAQGLYEPVHGSAPDIAGHGRANPLAAILSLSMMLRYSLAESDLADRLDQAVGHVLDSGLRTADIAWDNQYCTTAQMGDAVIEQLRTNLNDVKEI